MAILDTETTGTNFGRDKIIELGMVLVEVCPETGQAYRIVTVFDELEDPGMPIPEESTRIHHISNEMVSGKRINDAEVEALIAGVSLVVAHNAGFDRLFVEERFPIFATKAWACSFIQIPWSEEGIGSAKLEFLAYRCGFHFTGHRATTDCHALLEVLQHPLQTKQQFEAAQSIVIQLMKDARRPEQDEINFIRQCFNQADRHIGIQSKAMLVKAIELATLMSLGSEDTDKTMLQIE